MDKPIYLGFAVLELKKSHMYDSHYDKLQPLLEEQRNNYTIWMLINMCSV